MATSIVTAKVIDFNAAREARKASQQTGLSEAAARAVADVGKLNLEQSIRRDAVRRAARAAL